TADGARRPPVSTGRRRFGPLRSKGGFDDGDLTPEHGGDVESPGGPGSGGAGDHGPVGVWPAYVQNAASMTVISPRSTAATSNRRGGPGPAGGAGEGAGGGVGR